MWTETFWPTDWSQIFSPELSIVEKMIRPIIVYFFLMIGFRLAGKRKLAQLNSMDLIVLLTISNTVQNAIIGRDDSISGGLIGAATLLFLNHVIVRFLYGHDKIDKIVEGTTACLIEGGKINEDVLRHELITHEELEAAAHKQGFASLAHVDRAVLEAGGVISFVGKEPPAEELRHDEVTRRLDQIVQELGQLRAALATRK